MSEVEKSVAEQLKELMDAQVAEKADKADLEGLAKSEDLEGVVKSEQLEEVKSVSAEAIEAAKAEIREEMEAKFAAVPALETKAASVKSVYSFEKNVSATGEETMRCEIPLMKSVTGAQVGVGTGAADIVGDRVDAESVFYTLEQFNPFRAVATVMPVSAGSFKIPELSGISFSADGNNVPTLSQGNRAAPGGATESRTVVIEQHSSYSQFSRASLEDVDGMRAAIGSLILQEYSKTQAQDAAAVLKAGVAATTGAGALASIDVAVAGGPTATSILSNMSDLIQAVNVAYQNGGQFHVSQMVYGLLSQANLDAAGGLEFDPTSGVTRLFGYPVAVNAYLDTGATDTDVSAYFGQFGRGLILAERRSLSIDEYDQTLPGYNTYFAEGRFKNAIWDNSALAGLQTTA